MNKFVPEFKIDNIKAYEVKTIRDNVVYIKKADGNLSGLYYLVV